MVELGMSPDEAGALRPDQIPALVRAWERRERRYDQRFGILAFLLAEPNRDRDARSQPFHPADFFPSLEDTRPGPPEEEELGRKLEEAFKRLGMTD